MYKPLSIDFVDIHKVSERSDMETICNAIKKSYIELGDFTIVLSDGQEIKRNLTLLQTFIPYFRRIVNSKEGIERKITFNEFTPEAIKCVIDNAISWNINTIENHPLEYWVELYELFYFFEMDYQCKKLSSPIRRLITDLSNEKIISLPDSIKNDLKKTIAIYYTYNINPWPLQLDCVLNEVNLKELFEDESYRLTVMKDAFIKALKTIYNKNISRKKNIPYESYGIRRKGVLNGNIIKFLFEDGFELFMKKMDIDKINTPEEFEEKLNNQI